MTQSIFDKIKLAHISCTSGDTTPDDAMQDISNSIVQLRKLEEEGSLSPLDIEHIKTIHKICRVRDMWLNDRFDSDEAICEIDEVLKPVELVTGPPIQVPLSGYKMRIEEVYPEDELPTCQVCEMNVEPGETLVEATDDHDIKEVYHINCLLHEVINSPEARVIQYREVAEGEGVA